MTSLLLIKLSKIKTYEFVFNKKDNKKDRYRAVQITGKREFFKGVVVLDQIQKHIICLNVQGTQKERFRRPRAVNKAKLERADQRGVLLEQTRGHNWKEETQQVYAAVSGLIKLTESVIGFIFIWLTGYSQKTDPKAGSVDIYK